MHGKAHELFHAVRLGQQGGHALYHLADHLIGDYHMDFEGREKAINSYTKSY